MNIGKELYNQKSEHLSYDSLTIVALMLELL